MPARKRLTLLYHFFHPDDVISARLFSEIATWAAEEGWDVAAYPSSRLCHDPKQTLASREIWGKVKIHRQYRPAWSQSSAKGRIFNALFMLFAWKKVALFAPRGNPDVMVVGTDPTLGVLATLPWRIFRPRAKIIHWCHDVYPEAAIADGLVSENGILTKLLKWLLGKAYRRCDSVVDLGICMRELLGKYKHRRPEHTFTPWSLVEPETPTEVDQEFRSKLFGTAKIGMLYSGNLGRAHQFEIFLDLARELRDNDVGFCFAGRGPRVAELEAAIDKDDSNITMAGFIEESMLERRLSSADVHLVSLQENWTGTVVPSKFFGALATGRLVIFAGDENCCLAKWIRDYEIGWVLSPDSLAKVAEEIRQLASEPERIAVMRQRCFDVYQSEFSRQRQRQNWMALFRSFEK